MRTTAMAMEPIGVREIVTCQQVLLDHGVFAFLWHRSSKAFLLKLAVRTGFDHVHTMGAVFGVGFGLSPLWQFSVSNVSGRFWSAQVCSRAAVSAVRIKRETCHRGCELQLISKKGSYARRWGRTEIKVGRLSCRARSCAPS